VVVGALSFRYGLKGSYFALVTLAFAEVFRIVALSVPFTGAGVGLMVPLRGVGRQPAVRLTPGFRADRAGASWCWRCW
jgi:ABC-type branched-subunit amino acid transport system permease subunit